MKKVYISVLAIISTLAILVSLFVFSTVTKKKEITRLIKEERQAKNVGLVYHSLKEIKEGNKNYYYFSPLKKNSDFYQSNLPISLYKEKNKNKEIILIKPYGSPTALKGIKEIKIHKVVYKENFFSLKKVSDQIISHYHVKEDFSPFHLSDFITGDTKVVEEVVKNQDSNFPLEDIKRQDLTEDKGILTNHLEIGQTELVLKQKVHLPYQKLYDIIDPNYLSTKVKTDYDLYLAQKKSQLANEKRVALTFDDGPNPSTTPRVLDILKKYHAKATFFMLGNKIAGNEALVKRLSDEGNEVGNHSFDHSYFTKLSNDQIKSQIENTNALIESACGKKPIYFRPPYGATDERVKQICGMPQMLWTVDTKDWQNHNTSAMMTNIKNQLQPNAVILMHDIHETSVNALPTILDYLTSQGYHFVTVSQLMTAQVNP